MENEDNAEKDFSHLHFAVIEGDIETVIKLINQGHNVNAFDTDCYNTPIYYAARYEQLDIAQYLIDHGGDIDRFYDGEFAETLLGSVACDCSLAMAQLLIKAGANPTIKNKTEISAIDHASFRTDEEGIKVYKLLKSTAEKFT
jgi:ankyrin repeat protein